MTLKEDGKYVLVVRCSQFGVPSPGAKKEKCCECGEDVWLCKSLQNMEVDGYVCLECMSLLKDIEKEFTIPDEVKKEFHDWVKKWVNRKHN